MPLFLARLLRRTSRQALWLLPALVAGFVFVTGWLLMALAQPGSDIVQADNYWWWFLITTTTVGYGDHFPVEMGGKLVGAYVIAGGIATVAILLTQISSLIENAKGRRMQGQGSHSRSDHLAILGYTPGRTERLVGTLREDDPGREIVVCAWDDQATDHPMLGDERVHFVRGDLADVPVLRRAALDRARSVLVDTRDDNEAVTVTVAVVETAPEVHTVVALRDLARTRTISRVAPAAQCVQWHATRMITEELQDPGIAQVYAELAAPGGASTFSAVVPDEAPAATYGAWHAALGSAHAATLLAVRDQDGMHVGTDWETRVAAGSRLYYVAARRLRADELAGAVAVA